jgi:hypothetical protein
VGIENATRKTWPQDRVKKFLASARKSVRTHGGSWEQVRAGVLAVDQEQARAQSAERQRLLVGTHERFLRSYASELGAHDDLHASMGMGECEDALECATSSGPSVVRAHADVLLAFEWLVWVARVPIVLRDHKLRWWQRSVGAFCYFMNEYLGVSHTEIAVLRLTSSGAPINDDIVERWVGNSKQLKSEFKRKVVSGEFKVPARHWGLRSPKERTRLVFAKKQGGQVGRRPRRST